MWRLRHPGGLAIRRAGWDEIGLNSSKRSGGSQGQIRQPSGTQDNVATQDPPPLDHIFHIRHRTYVEILIYYGRRSTRHNSAPRLRKNGHCSEKRSAFFGTARPPRLVDELSMPIVKKNRIKSGKLARMAVNQPINMKSGIGTPFGKEGGMETRGSRTTRPSRGRRRPYHTTPYLERVLRKIGLMTPSSMLGNPPLASPPEVAAGTPRTDDLRVKNKATSIRKRK